MMDRSNRIVSSGVRNEVQQSSWKQQKRFQLCPDNVFVSSDRYDLPYEMRIPIDQLKAMFGLDVKIF